MANVSIGQLNNDAAKAIYRNCRQIIDVLVRSGKIDEKDSEKEWAKLVQKKLIESGFPVPREIQSKAQ